MAMMFNQGKKQRELGMAQLALSQKTAEQNQRQALAAVAKQSAEADQEKVAGRRPGRAGMGRRLLTFLNADPGMATLG